MLSQLISQYWPLLFPGESKPDNLALVKNGGWNMVGAPVSFLVFKENDCQPSFHLKVNRDTLSSQNIRREYETYRRIYDRTGRSKTTIPQPLACETVGEYVVFVERFLPGEPFDMLKFSERNVDAIQVYFEQTLEWLLSFQVETRESVFTVNDAFIDAHLGEALEIVKAQHPDEWDTIEPGLAWLERELGRFAGKEIPAVAVHGDFNHYNLLLNNRAVSVIDWEYCQVRGLPVDDLVFLYLEAAIACDPIPPFRFVPAFLALNDVAPWGGRSFGDGLARVASMHQLDIRLARLLVPVYLLKMLAFDYRGTSFPLRSPDTLRHALRYCGCTGIPI